MFRKLGLTLLTLAVLLSACAPAVTPATQPIKLMDGLKREVMLYQPAQRIDHATAPCAIHDHANARRAFRWGHWRAARRIRRTAHTA